jgi:AcrR family transcriptional regulator
MNKQNLSREIIINKTLELIEEKQSIQKINLRKIAKELNCAHTNLYNYFSNYNDLLWNALAEAIKIMNQAIFTEKSLDNIIDSFIQFSIDHKGLYRLIWYERVEGEVPEKIKELLLEPQKKTYENLKDNYENWDIVSKKIQVSLAYVHGEITIMINNRIIENSIDEESWKQNIKRNAINIFNKY